MSHAAVGVVKIQTMLWNGLINLPRIRTGGGGQATHRLATFSFKIEGEVVISEEGDEEETYTFNAYYEQDGERVRIIGEALQLDMIYDGAVLRSREQ